jgi:hypothetical protein
MIIKAFIQANTKQLLGAEIAKACIERHSKLSVKILNVDSMNLGLQNLKYMRGGVWSTFDPNDLQSFTLVRFLPPTLMDFKGYALVIDPDIFAISDLKPLLKLAETSDFDIMACQKKNAFDSSVMLINCERLRWLSWKNLLCELSVGSIDYIDLMSINLNGLKVQTIERRFNQLDDINDDTVFFHTTNRLTQPWKTGLRIDFARNIPGYSFGIPKLWILKVLGRWPSRYQTHPNSNVESTFFHLAQLALQEGKINTEDILEMIAMGYIRKDFMAKLMKC